MKRTTTYAFNLVQLEIINMQQCPIGLDYHLAAQLLRAGKLVSFVTETVYGLGGHALNEQAVAGIFAAKERPKFDPLIVHVATMAQVHELCLTMSPLAMKLATKFWPGPLTLILPKRDVVPDIVTAGLQEVAVRIPNHPVTKKLLEITNIPIAAPSANLFGQVSPTTAKHVADQLGDRIDYILDGGPTTIGLESTVIRVIDHEVQLLRYGGLSLEAIEEFLQQPITISIQHLDQVASVSPGQLHKHYAPRTPLEFMDYDSLRQRLYNSHEHRHKLGVLALNQPVINAAQISIWVHLSEQGDLVEAASQLFSKLRELDQQQLDGIIALKFPETGLGRAINDRLQRGSVKT